jgi:hypothetical protein
MIMFCSLKNKLVLSISFVIQSFILCSQNYPHYKITALTNNSEGYYFLTAVNVDPKISNASFFQMILDRSGDLVYFKRFSPEFKTIDFKLQANGLISYYCKNKFYLMNHNFEIVDSVWCKNNYLPDHHDLQILENGNFLLMCMEEVVVNLSAHKIFKPDKWAGSPSATVQCGVIQELDVNKNVVFEWHAKKHYKFLDFDTAWARDPKKVDWTHFNAIAPSTDGNILVSTRYFNEITKINRRDSSVIWRLGGIKNEFTFINDTIGFIGQHDIRQLSNGNITLYDNGTPSSPFHPATAKEYQIDENNKTVSLVWKYINNPTAHSRIGLGNVQRLRNGNTLVNYGNSSSNTMFTVVEPSGKKVFEITFDDTLRTYRAFNYPENTLQLKRPLVQLKKANSTYQLETKDVYNKLLWSTGEQMATIKIKNPGKYQAYVPIGNGGFIASEPIIITSNMLE